MMLLVLPEETKYFFIMANGLEGTKVKKWRLTTMKKTIVIAAMAGIMAVAGTTGKYEIKNFVKRTCNQATIGMRAYKGSGVARGKWSPDCLGSYTVLQ